ncbi:MAG: response regulator [Coriobacteriia bacterium]|nr:response regulator [Coriobacteriia bacterium]
MKLLIVDDSSVIRKVIRAATDVLEIEAEEARDGVEALEMIQALHEELCLILLDWNMPRKNGYEVLLEIKSDERYKHIPVMMVTTEGQRDNTVAAVRAGASNYLTKPFTVEEMEVKIIECLGKGGAR